MEKKDKTKTSCCGKSKGGCPRNICCGHCPDREKCPYDPCMECISNTNATNSSEK